MIRFENIEVFNFEGAIRGMRNSWQSWSLSDSEWVDGDYINDPHFKIGPEDHKLMMNLSKAGPEHAKYLRQIFISTDIIAPEYWWKETDQYSFFTTNSTSMIHTLGKSLTPQEAFSMEDVDEDLKEKYFDILHEAQRRWYESGKKKPSKEWRQMNQLTAISFLYRRTFTSNYGQLRTMYFQRNRHKLQEWRDFAAFVESLPYSELITLKTK